MALWLFVVQEQCTLLAYESLNLGSKIQAVYWIGRFSRYFIVYCALALAGTLACGVLTVLECLLVHGYRTRMCRGSPPTAGDDRGDRDE
jgi:hypothetical protein